MEAVNVVNDVEVVRAAHGDALARFPAAADAETQRRFDATLAYVWAECRCGILVVIRDWRVRVWMPFCNLGFTNTWGCDLTLGERVNEALPVDRWWCNADLVCTRAQGDRGWGTAQNDVYLALVDAALKAHPVRFASVILNKRDHPLLRRDGSSAYNHVWSSPRPRVLDNPDQLLPILSVFTGNAFLDRGIPCAQDWDTHTFPPLRLTRWANRRPCALFRGTRTNPVRERLCAVFADDPRFDVKLTRSAGGRLVANRGHVSRVPASGDAAAFLPPETWSRYRVVLAVDGHAGLNRWAHLARSGAYIVRVATACEAGEAFLATCVPHDVVDATVPGWEDRLVAMVETLVARGRGPHRASNLRERMLQGVARALGGT